MEALILLAILVCPIVMGTMMFLMWRGMRGSTDGRRAREEATAAATIAGDHREEAGR
jgi:hypothetical protein